MSNDVIPQILRGVVLPLSLSWVIVLLAGVGGIVAIIANLSFTIRRLHDIGFSGWFAFLYPFAMLLVAGDLDHPTVGAANIAFETVLMMVPGIAGTNIYGRNSRVTATELSASP